MRDALRTFRSGRLALTGMVAALLLAVPAAHAQSPVNYLTITTVTANEISDAGGAGMPLGKFCAYATDQNDRPIPFLVGTTYQAVKQSVCVGVMTGQFSGALHLANPAATNPLNIRYHVTITNTASHQATEYPGVQIVVANGVSTWDWASWNPAVGTSIPVTSMGPPGPTGPAGAGFISGLASDLANGIAVTGAVNAASVKTNKILPVLTTLVAEGDSITFGVNTSSNSKRYPDVALTLPAMVGRSITYYNFAVSGNRVADLVSRYTASVKPKCVAGGALLSVMIGTNNLGADAQTDSAVFTALSSYVSTAKADGCAVGVWTILPRSDSIWTQTMEGYRQALNRTIKSWALPDFVFDGEAILPSSGDPNVFPDHLHPNDSGNNQLAVYMDATLRGGKYFYPYTGAGASFAPGYFKSIPLADGSDLNNALVGGSYSINGPINGPPGSSSTPSSGNSLWYVRVAPYDSAGAWTEQTATILLGSYNPQTWQRIRQNGTWQSWVPVYGSGLVSSTDLNNLTACGTYNGSNLTNGPFGTAWTHILVLCSDPSTGPTYAAQIATPLQTGSSQMMMRIDNGGTWGVWAAVLGTSLLAASTDLNTITTPGSYDGQNLTNSPLGSAWTHLVVFGSDITTGINWPVQFATNFLGGTTALYERVDNNGTWSGWSQAALFDSSGNLSIGTGTNVVYRCATAGATLPVGSLTISSGACGTTADTGLRVK